MRSLRARIVGWYVGVGVFIVAIVSLLAATVLVEGRAYEARQTMTAVAATMPDVVAGYRAAHPDLGGIDRFLREHFRAQGVIVHVLAPPPALPPPPAPRPPPLHVGFAGHLVAMAIRPMHVRFPGGAAVIFTDPQSLAGTFQGFGLFVLVLALVVLTASWRIALVVADHTLQPLVNTTAALRRFGSGAFTKVAVRDEDRGETAELARAYNAAVEQTTSALSKRDQAEAEMRQFVADAGHQLRTPLTVITGYVSAMLTRAQSSGEREPYESMLAQARRMKALIDALVTLARLEHPNATPIEEFDADELMARVRSGFDETSRRRIVVHPCAEPITLRAQEADVSEALCALVENSLKYAPGAVEIAARHGEKMCAITVADNGPGMTREDLAHACDRFYRGSNADGVEGSGLGLSIVRKSIERSGGSVRFANRPSGGLLATITLPCVQLVVDRERRVVAEPRIFIDGSVSNARR